ATYLRTVLLEMERIYSHLGDMAGMIVDVAFPRGASRFFILREEMFRRNDLLTGSRFMKGALRPGGLNRDIPAESLAELAKYFDGFAARFESAIESCSISSVIDRLETTGVIRKERVPLLNITGPAARAAGINIDTRCDHPYGLYAELGTKIATAEKGDVMSRFNVKAQEIRDSVRMIRGLIARMPPGEIRTDFKAKDGYALSVVEAPRGQSLHWVYVKNGVVERYKIRTASFCNWQAIEHAVMGNIVPDFPLINKSLNLSYAGTDL
ncbi:MAG TPA: hydrogenase large subunit, partial [Dehalococcoidales bacterium]|nr:hydrogenase large subunit [Dehalococcoidales bacterium]